MATQSTEWQLLFRLPGGHKFFKNQEGRIAVADHSGATPDLTDDGPLFIQMDKRIEIITSGRDFANIPVLTSSGEVSHIIERPGNALFIAERFGMAIETSNGVFSITR